MDTHTGMGNQGKKQIMDVAMGLAALAHQPCQVGRGLPGGGELESFRARVRVTLLARRVADGRDAVLAAGPAAVGGEGPRPDGRPRSRRPGDGPGGRLRQRVPRIDQEPSGEHLPDLFPSRPGPLSLAGVANVPGETAREREPLRQEGPDLLQCLFGRRVREDAPVGGHDGRVRDDVAGGGRRAHVRGHERRPAQDGVLPRQPVPVEGP